MKLKNVLVSAFLTLTLIPIMIALLLLYKSGYELSKESYIRNLTESISVQTDYIVQTIDNNMISDYRFTQQNSILFQQENRASETRKNDLYTAFQTYLEDSGDKITVCLLLDKENNPIYTIGEAGILETVQSKLPPLLQLGEQTMIEFELEPEVYSLGIVTPMRDADNAYAGCLISIYDQAYFFKVISSYYKIADTSTYICEGTEKVSKQSLKKITIKAEELQHL